MMNRSRWWYAVAAAAALLGGWSLTGAPAAANGDGFSYHVTGHGKAATGVDDVDHGYVDGSALLVGPAGGTHVLWARNSAHPVVSVTQRQGSRTWHRHATSLHLSGAAVTASYQADATSVALGLSIDQRRLYAVATDCAGVYTTSARATKMALPRFHKAIDEPAKVCEYEADDDGVYQGEEPHYRLSSAVALPHHRVGLLITTRKRKAGGAQYYRSVLYAGRPGHAFHVESMIPHAAGIDAFARDPVTGELVAASEGTSGSTPTLVAWTKQDHKPWSQPTVLATGSDDYAHHFDYLAQSVAVSNRRVYVAVTRDDQYANGANNVDDALLVTRTKHGTWRGVQHFPHLNPKTDGSLLLLTNPATHHVHVAFSRSGSVGRPVAMLESTYVRGAWTTPTYVKHHCYCTAEDLAFDPAGHLVIGYQRIAPG